MDTHSAASFFDTPVLTPAGKQASSESPWHVINIENAIGGVSREFD